MRTFFVNAVIASFFITLALGRVGAQTKDPILQIACIPGQTMAQKTCGVSQIKESLKNLIQIIVRTVLMIAVVGLGGSLLWDYYKNTEATAQFFTSMKKRITGFVFASLGLAATFGSLSFLRDIGVGEEFLKYASYLLSLLPVETAYAAGEINPVIKGTWWDMLFNFIRALWTWVMFPLLIGGWFLAGFKYVAAQGNPQKIKEAHGITVAIVLLSVFVLFVQGFVSSLKDGI